MTLAWFCHLTCEMEVLTGLRPTTDMSGASVVIRFVLLTIQIFLRHMLSFPEHRFRAQEELDRVVGSERMPTWEDEEKLPYLMACIKESMRLQPAANIGMWPG